MELMTKKYIRVVLITKLEKGPHFEDKAAYLRVTLCSNAIRVMATIISSTSHRIGSCYKTMRKHNENIKCGTIGTMLSFPLKVL